MQPDEGYRLPAEFERHAATYLLWPMRPDNWREKARYAHPAFLKLARIISGYEPVRFGFSTQTDQKVITEINEGVKPVHIEYNDVWVRDTGPTVLVKSGKSRIAIDWKFNSWGGLFDQVDADDAVAQRIANLEGLQIIKAPIVLEGGAIATDGARTLLVTEESVLNDNRNPGLTKSEATKIFNKFLGATSVIWLPRGLANDEAGGHIDNVCAFADARTILVADTNDTDHPSFSRVREINQFLKNSTNLSGQPYQIIPLPLPPPMCISEEESAGFSRGQGQVQRAPGTPMAPSYINLYIANGVVVVPTFGENTDEAALSVIRAAFPNRETVPFASRELLLGGGAVHCVTRDIPTAQ